MNLLSCKCGWWGEDDEAEALVDENYSECHGERVCETLTTYSCPDCESEDLDAAVICVKCERDIANETGYCDRCAGPDESDLSETLTAAITHVALRKI